MRPVFIGSEIYRLPAFKPPHPLATPRAMLAKDICTACGWLEAGQYMEAGVASVAELTRFHDAGYIAALMRHRLHRAAGPQSSGRCDVEYRQ